MGGLRLLLMCTLYLALPTDACMAGFEAEREKLREYLGIEWVQHGLDRNGVQGNRPIRHSSDLNCNFTTPEKCRWRNADPSMRMDTREFHLFEKEDLTEWPVLRIQPGPTKVNVGEKMILTGDKKREEQDALFFSSVIPCQSGVGNFTFTYWSFNNARIEIIILEEDKKGKLQMLPDKPYIDCGTVPVNTNCHVEIPARETPFRLGIHAYNIASREGSFIIVDDLLFTAPLCKVAIDLGASYDSSPLVTSARGEKVRRAADLNCARFDSSCRWRSTGKANPMWQRSASVLPSTFITQVTGSDISPKDAYSILYIQQDTELPLEALRSDPIECQAISDNELSFRFWATADVVLEACALSVDSDGVIECHRLPSGISPAPVKVSLKKATKNFYIAIRIVSLHNRVDNVVIVDDITYKAIFCNEALSPLDLGVNFAVTPMLSVLLEKHVSSAKDLWCDFSRRASDCAWGPVETENLEAGVAVKWLSGHGPLDNEKFFSLTRQTQMPNGDFGVVRFEQRGSALLLSEMLTCVVKQASLSFHLWTTGAAVLRICLVEESSPSLLDCQAAVAGAVTVELPRVDRPFRIALRADSDGRGIVIIDEIKMNGDVCDAARQYSAKAFHPSQSSAIRPDVNVCRLLSCSFSRGHPCLYDSSQLQQSAQFTVTNGVLSAELNSTRPLAILESVPFQLNTVARLHFIYSIFNDVTLFVCNDSAGKELDNCFKVDGTGGEDYVELLPSDTKVYLLARSMNAAGPGGSIQVKKLYLTDPLDIDAC